uniref:C2H2-type domain-containing protein n=1 Tax=Neogobius melanostomus TaxID=47308 RepID=A0A8C6T8G2_9GOBI
MAEVKLKEEQELWEPAEVENSVVHQLKEEPGCGGVQSHEEAGHTLLHVKEEPEEVNIPHETSSACPFIRVIVKSEDEEENSEDRDAAEEEKSSDTDDSGDFTPSAESHIAQTQTEQQQEPANGNDVNAAGASDKPHKCSYCGKRFATGARLKIHVRTHTGEKPFKCSVCAMGFSEKGILKTHMMTHTGERPLSCTVCSKTFILNSHLKVHMRSHTGERPFSCPVCSKEFVAKSPLNAHLRAHTGEKPHKCTFCSKCFLPREV